MAPVEVAEPGTGRSVALLVLYLLGCAAVAAGAALGLGTVWQDLYAWVFPQVIGDAVGG